MKDLLVIIDNGHNAQTPGKCSPDGKIKEYLYCNKLACALQEALLNISIPSILVHPELNRVGSTEKYDINIRVKRANSAMTLNSELYSNFIFVSIHLNAAGSASACGFCPFVAPNASRKSKQLATCFTDNAREMGLGGNRKYDHYVTGNFAVVRDTKMPVVLTENLFMTNEKDEEFLLSEEGFNTIVDLHVNSILDYLECVQK